jgi:hypothetical protein
MAHFAELNNENIVIGVNVIPDSVLIIDGVESEEAGIDFCEKLWGHRNFKQTSYNTIAGVHLEGKEPFRKNFAGIGYKFDIERNAFIPKKPYEAKSFVLDEEKCQWVPPFSHPLDGKNYRWNENILNYEEFDPNDI